nr:MAG TPA: hypothetical protein [Caudoviricetes sp.]
MVWICIRLLNGFGFVYKGNVLFGKLWIFV